MKNQLLTQRVISEEVYRNVVNPQGRDREILQRAQGRVRAPGNGRSCARFWFRRVTTAPEKVAAAEKKAKETG